MASTLRFTDTVSVTRQDQQTVELSIEQLTPRTIATVFSISPVS